MKWILCLLFLTSCAHIKNGYHVQRKAHSSYGQLAKTYGVSLQALKDANHNEEFKKLDWVFIPKKVGFLGYWQLKQKQTPKEAIIADEKEEVAQSKKVASKKTVIAKGKDAPRKKLKLIWPVPDAPLLSSRYGMRRKRMHHGIDIPAPIGTPIVAAEAGKVIYSDSRISGYGKMIILAHENDYVTVYAHASKNLYKEGDYVKRGDIISLVGITGRVTGAHLHFEVRRKDKSIDPLKFLKIPKKKKRRRNLASNSKKKRSKKIRR